MSRYNVTRDPETITELPRYQVVEAPKSKWSPPGMYATQAEARAAADDMEAEAVARAATPRQQASTCCDCGDVGPLSHSPRGMICQDCASMG